jgi:hypothetical protein
MIAMERPFRAARIAERYPAGPLPIMIKSNCWVEDSMKSTSFYQFVQKNKRVRLRSGHAPGIRGWIGIP